MGLSRITTSSITDGIISVTDFANTGDVRIYSPSANTLVAYTTTAERLRIDSSGNVGIGTASPVQKLDVSGNVNISGTNIFANSAALYVPTVASTANIDFKVGASLNTSFRIESTGRLYNSVDSDTGTDYRSTLYPGTLCRAWVNFDGTGTVAIRASGNVSSIGDLGVGYYEVNFTTAMPDANYASHVIASPVGIGAFMGVPQINITNVGQTESAPAAGSFRFILSDEAFAGYRDCKYVNVAIFR